MIIDASSNVDDYKQRKFYKLTITERAANANSAAITKAVNALGGARKRAVSLAELRHTATSLAVKGRSSMNKDELVCAIRKHKRSIRKRA